MSKVREWCFSTAMGIFKKPETDGDNEFNKTRLFGKVFDDPRRDILTREFDNGHRIITSPIVEINWEERCIITRSGTKYNLEGNPNNEYIEWLKESGCWDNYSSLLLAPSNELD